MKPFLKTLSAFLLGAFFWAAAFGLYGRFEYVPKNASAPVVKVSHTGSEVISVPMASATPSACFSGAEVSVFMYHYVRDPVPQDNKIIVQLSVPPKTFEEHMRYVRSLADSGRVTLLSTDELEKAVQSHCYPAKHIFAFTADDGWIDSYTALAPIARKYRIPFTFGIITSRLHVNGFMNEGEVKALADDPLFAIASHSVSHDDEDAMAEAEERKQICDSRDTLERLTGKKVPTYIFPSGRMSAASVRLLRECGYELGFSTSYWKPWNESSRYLDSNRVRVFPESKTDYFDHFAGSSEEKSQGALKTCSTCRVAKIKSPRRRV